MGRINRLQVNKKKINNKLNSLIKDLDRTISIKVGIFQNAPAPEGTSLSMADLGAIHEFGATIPVTKKMRNYLHRQGLHLKKETTSVVIPTRSFLRMPLLSKEGKKYINDFLKTQLASEKELDKLFYEDKPELLTKVAEATGYAAYLRVMSAFDTSGFGKWPDITGFTKTHRVGNANNPPLNDRGDLQDSITWKVEE